jgi:ubiquinone/menaquinone biosynthesis C-methylase UbiE
VLHRMQTYSEPQDFREKESLLSDITDCLSRVARLEAPSLFENKLVLEVGGSGGLLAGLLSNCCARVVCSDVVDHNDAYGGEFCKLLREKFVRNGHHIRLERLEFHKVDAQDLIYRDELFDIVISQNAFEHIPDPAKALRECLRVLKPGGLFFATFDPVWTADSGSHFLHRVGEPWMQLIASDDGFVEVMRSNGAEQGEVNSYLNDMNRRPVSYYRKSFPPILAECCDSFNLESWSGCVEKAFRKHPNRIAAAQLLGLDPDDLLIRGFKCVCVKSKS